MDLATVRRKILEEKEKRWQNLIKQLKEMKIPVISLRLNIPSWPKNNSLIRKSFENILTDIREYFAKNDLLVQKELINTSNLGPEALFFINFKPEKLKQKMIELEENHIIGRILDIDVIDKTGKPIERNRKRKCLLCDKLAIICMRESNHSPIELREVIDKELEKYLILHEKEK